MALSVSRDSRLVAQLPDNSTQQPDFTLNTNRWESCVRLRDPRSRLENSKSVVSRQGRRCKATSPSNALLLTSSSSKFCGKAFKSRGPLSRLFETFNVMSCFGRLETGRNPVNLLWAEIGIL